MIKIEFNNGESPYINDTNLNQMQDNIEKAIDEKTSLPTGGTSGQVLTKQSDEEGDVVWADVLTEETEIFIGSESEAPETAKVIIDPEEDTIPQVIGPIIDNLESDSKVAALSANQGRVLNEEISNLKPKLLWENTGDPSTMAAQTITLSSSDYDYLIVFAYRNQSAIGGATKTVQCIIEKNMVGELNYSDYTTEVRSWKRLLEITNDTSISIGDATINNDVNNIVLVPYKIVGLKY